MRNNGFRTAMLGAMAIVAAAWTATRRVHRRSNCAR